MVKKKGKRKEPRRQHLRSMPTLDETDSAEPAEENLALIQQLRAALRGEHPLDFLDSASAILSVADDRNRDPFADDPTVTGEELLESFLGSDFAETTALLHVMRTFATDEVRAARIGRELARRSQPMPEWLTRLPDAEITRVTSMIDLSGDGDDYFLEVRLATGEMFTVLVYVDHNLGTVVKDAFTIPAPFEQIRSMMAGDLTPEQVVEEADPALVRVVITDAIETGARTWPPLESEHWPLCRPLVEWLVHQLPEGGQLPDHREWTDDDLAELRAEFAASRYGDGHGGVDDQSLLESVMWFGTGCAGTDPLRWTAVRTEILLTDWFPRKVVAEVDYLAKLPDLLRAYIRFCHDRRGARPELTTEVLAAVDHWEPTYQDLIRDEARHQGPAALVARLLESGALPEDFDPTGMQLPGLGLDGMGDDWLSSDPGAFMLEMLDRAVGGRDALMTLDTAELPDEAFVWDGIPEDVRPRITEVRDWCDRCAEELFDVEHRTAMRRLLHRSAVSDPAIFRRNAKVNRTAATLAWIITRASDTTGAHFGGFEVQELLAWFGVSGSVSQRAEVFLRAIGMNPHQSYLGVDLGTPDLLVSERRARIIEQRDLYLAMESRT